MNSSSLSLAVCKAQKLEILRCVHFLAIWLFIGSPSVSASFQIADAAFQFFPPLSDFCTAIRCRPHTGSLAPRLSYSQSNSFRCNTFIIKGDSGPPCGLPSVVAIFTPFFHHSAFQKFLNQLNDPHHPSRFPAEGSAVFMVQRVKVLLLKSSCTAHSYPSSAYPES